LGKKGIRSPCEEKILFRPKVAEELRAIEQKTALKILEAIHRYAENAVGNVKPLAGERAGLLRLRVANHRVLFDESADTITIHRVR